MGVNADTDRIMRKALVGKDLQRLGLVLIGDLIVRPPLARKVRHKASDYYRPEFRRVLSLDRNGMADCRVDLAVPVDWVLRDNFDILVNGGTAEHVWDQKVFFDNCHNLTTIDGIMLHVVPEVGSFSGHSKYYYDQDFFTALAKDYNYTMLHFERIKHRQGWAIYAAFKKRRKKKKAHSVE